jgi:hypothetical protein
MHIARPFMILFIGASAGAWAQSSSSLSMQLPANAEPTQSSPAPESTAPPDPAASTAAPPSAPPLPAPYDEPYGTRRDAAQKKRCDDETYGQPQVHGSVGMGVAAGNRVSGNYQTGTITVTKALGSCDDPKGIVSASISVSQSNVNSRRRSRP